MDATSAGAGHPGSVWPAKVICSPIDRLAPRPRAPATTLLIGGIRCRACPNAVSNQGGFLLNLAYLVNTAQVKYIP